MDEAKPDEDLIDLGLKSPEPEFKIGSDDGDQEQDEDTTAVEEYQVMESGSSDEEEQVSDNDILNQILARNGVSPRELDQVASELKKEKEDAVDQKSDTDV